MRRGTVALVALLVLTGCRADPARQVHSKPDLYVLTSLPLIFEEGFGLGPAAGEAAAFLRERYAVKPVDLPSQLPPGALLLAAQPRALPAEELVVLDAWVRGGGKMLLLADPMLEWPSERALGDRLRPPVSFADTGLLAHWGLRLDAPDKRGLRLFPSEMTNVTTNSPGRLVKLGGECSPDPTGISASCRIGLGEVVVIADADWLNVEAVSAAGGNKSENLSAFDVQLARLSSKAE